MRHTMLRGLAEEVAKHFQGTPASRLRAARRLGRRALELFRVVARRYLAPGRAPTARGRPAPGTAPEPGDRSVARMSLVDDVVSYLGKRRVKCALIGGEALAVRRPR
jgi:hypothetical protein